jgi:hypothetical protein
VSISISNDVDDETSRDRSSSRGSTRALPFPASILLAYVPSDSLPLPYPWPRAYGGAGFESRRFMSN